MSTHEKFLALKDAGVVVEGLVPTIVTRGGETSYFFHFEDEVVLALMDAAVFKAMPEKLPGLSIVCLSPGMWWVGRMDYDEWVSGPEPTATDAYLAAWAARKET